ncbi:hypothetical protein TRFO_17448 [Tritrichomonas foetus]|uniref:Tetraspanin family protein n=1 Tax=Tritrichomonas foetus TaxID=1144522 RepID=A0A1J4KNY1_9EUKA|nr:hypothetical protein TRFO_17448 [Tritrichomonas foetus]|eukprot:OHT12632.1 hypothetical protein TRFO_17448 [Tritrichomonas foetus]
MKPLPASIFICVINIIVGVVFIVANKTWLYLTGLINLTLQPLIISIFSLSLFYLSIVCITIYHYQQIVKVFNFFLLTSSFSVVLLLYFAFNWGINTPQLFQSLSYQWKSNVNTDIIIPIEYYFKCCGFFSINDIPEDNCTVSKKNSCLNAMQKNLSPSLHGASAFLCAQIVSLLLINFLFYQIVWTRDPHYHKSKKMLTSNIGI